MKALPSRYELLGGAKAGGMSTVIFCNDKQLERTVAVKFIKDKRHRRRMLDELSALLKLRSKHVVQVYDLIRGDDSELGIIQEFIDGNDLFAETYPRSSKENYLRTIWQIASGIADIHEIGVIHRDIKPNNMKLDSERIVKIFDFGLARDEGPRASTKGFIGTVGFAAPELYGTSASFTHAVDTYAFGATALYIATEDLPAKLKAAPPKKFTESAFEEIPFSLDPPLVALLDSCLAFDPSHRPLMCNVRDALVRYLLFDKHQALVVHKGKASYLNATKRDVDLDLPSIGSIGIRYNGLQFVVTKISGEVFLNNRAANVNDLLPGACVVSLGGGHRRANERAFITFDVSYPEITL